MIDINLKERDCQTGYDAVGVYICRYWEHNIFDTIVISLGVSCDGITYDLRKEIAYPVGYNGIEFLSDWWEGEQYIKLFGIKTVRELDISGGLYE